MANKISILPVARVMIAHYEDTATVQRVIYELVKTGVARHYIGTYVADDDGVDTERINVDRPEKLQQTVIRREVSNGILVVAWVKKWHEKEAEAIMKAHQPKDFKKRASNWQPNTGIPFEIFFIRKKQGS